MLIKMEDKPQEDKRMEASIGRSFRSLTEEQKWLVVKLHGSSMQSAGLPDYEIFPEMLKGEDRLMVRLEIKRPGKRLSKLQARTITELSLRGQLVVVSDSADLAVEACAWILVGKLGPHSIAALTNCRGGKPRVHSWPNAPGGFVVSTRRKPLNLSATCNYLGADW